MALHLLVYQQLNNRNQTVMNTLVKRVLFLLVATAFLAIVGVGCRTAHGFGEDMQNAGESIQDGTK